MNLSTLLQALYPDADPSTDYTIVSESGGYRLASWDTQKLGAEPARADLESRYAAAVVKEQSDSAELKTFSDKLEAGTLTAAEQRQLLKHIVASVRRLEALAK